MVKIIVYLLIIAVLLEIVVRDIREKIILNKSNLILLFLGIILGVLEENLQERVVGGAKGE